MAKTCDKCEYVSLELYMKRFGAKRGLQKHPQGWVESPNRLGGYRQCSDCLQADLKIVAV